MIRLLLVVATIFFFSGCSQSFASFNGSDASVINELKKQEQKSDEEVKKLEDEIAKLESDKVKYQQDYETYDNNAILDELDETLQDEQNSSDANTTKEEL